MVQKEVYDIITSLETVTGLGVCLYDLNRFFTYHYGALNKPYTGHYCEFCKAVRELPHGREACIKNDVVSVRELAQFYKKPFFHICHIGLCECIVPIMREEELLGIVFIGQCRITSETTYEKVLENIIRYQGEAQYFKRLFDSLPMASRQQLLSAGKLADLSFKSLVNQRDFDITAQHSDIAALAKNYISSNYMNHISLSQISKELHVNPSYLSRKFKEVTGMNISDYISGIRIEQARKLLIYTKIPIAHISYNVGFVDQNYFSRLFKRIVSQTPLEFRRNKADT